MEIASLIHLVLVLVIFGVCWYLLQTFAFPYIAQPFIVLITVVVVLALILYLLSLVGVVPPLKLHH